MLERNRPASSLPSAPSRSGDWFDGQGAGGLFASAEDYDATGILAGVDPCESRYWWVPDLFSSEAATPAQPLVDGLPLASTGAATAATEAVVERLRRNGQATRRNGSRSTAAA
jgi:hypothetical protein